MMERKMLKRSLVGVLGLAALAGCSNNLTEVERADVCVDRFQIYDSAVRTEGFRRRASLPRGEVFGFPDPSSNLLGAANALNQYRCVTSADAIADLGDPRGEYAEFRNGDSGLEISPKYLALGAVRARDTEEALTRFFAALGYPVRTVPAERLGRRIFIGPINSRGAERALNALAERIGFRSSYYVTQIPVVR